MTTVIYTGTRLPRNPPEELKIHHVPMLKPRAIDCSEEAIKTSLNRSEMAIFYSKNSIDIFLANYELRSELQDVSLRTVGPKTAEYLRDKTDQSVNCPDEHSFDGIVAELRDESGEDRRITSFELDLGRHNLAYSLEDSDWLVDNYPIYETAPAAYSSLIEKINAIDPHWIAFTSRRGIEVFESQLAESDRFSDLEEANFRLAAIGPKTGRALREIWRQPDLELEEPGADRLLAQIAEQSGDK